MPKELTPKQKTVVNESKPKRRFTKFTCKEKDNFDESFYALMSTVSNTVDIPSEDIEAMLDNAEALTSVISKHILECILPMHIGLSQSLDYAVLALKDGIGVEMEVDRDIEVILGCLTKIELVFLLVRLMKIPAVYKKPILDAIIAKSLDEAFSSIGNRTKMTDVMDSLRNNAISRTKGLIKPPAQKTLGYTSKK